MNRTFIDFPPWRKSRGLLQDLPLLAQDLVFTPQTLELGGHVLLPLLRRSVDLAFTAAINPVAQGRQADAEIRGNRPSAAATGQGEPHRLILKLFRKACLGHGDPPRLYECSPAFRSKTMPQIPHFNGSYDVGRAWLL
jgi:hypothetical protein